MLAITPDPHALSLTSVTGLDRTPPAFLLAIAACQASLAQKAASKLRLQPKHSNQEHGHYPG